MDYLKIDLMRSQYKIRGKYYQALCIDGRRHGPDAGPWDIVETYNIPVDDIKEALKGIERKAKGK